MGGEAMDMSNRAIGIIRREVVDDSVVSVSLDLIGMDEYAEVTTGDEFVPVLLPVPLQGLKVVQ